MANKVFLLFKTCSNQSQTRQKSIWRKVKMAPPDPIFGVNDAFNKDKNPKKVNLGVGAYRDDNGKPFVLKCIKKAEQIIASKGLNKEYLPIFGENKFIKASVKLAFGKDDRISQGLNASAQSLSGTGALFILARFLAMHSAGNRKLYVPKPTWGNHKNVCLKAGLKQKGYTYYLPKTRSLNFKGLINDINKMPEKSAILLQPSAHNPTGVDPSREQWKEISSAVKKRKLFAFFDMAYQGFATGDIDNDAYAVRLFAKNNHPMCLAQSFSKNMGLYGERVGCMTILCNDKSERDRVFSQLKSVIRGVYSNPPLHGERIAAEVLTNPQLRKLWLKEVKGMAGRVISMRKQLKSQLKKTGSKRDWNHITKQVGMFCFTGLNRKQIKAIARKFGVYMTNDGRMSVVGLTSKNVNYVAHAMHEVTK